jgi:tRNA threonylcarbamoyladenosine biosynthesis protein TsaE
MITKTITTLNELEHIADEILLYCTQTSHARIIVFSGDLGVGKTACVKILAQRLGIVHEITSPTFVIMKSYVIPTHAWLKTLTHIDAYRIKNEDEMRVLGFEEMMRDRTRLICIEWPEHISSYIPPHACRVSMVLNTDETRTISYDI